MQQAVRTTLSDQARYNEGPVAIGGVGGSGTRVIAEIAKVLGIYMGTTVNRANDHLGFLPTRQLLLEPNHVSRTTIITEQFRQFEKTMHSEFFEQKIYKNWGWKVPGQFYFLHYTSNYFPKMKYIHTIRHGLDMAFSRNKNQLRNWGPSLGIQAKSPDDPIAALEYWIRANDLAIEKGKSLLKDHFFLLNYDDLCKSPKQTISHLVEFITDDTSPSAEFVSELIELVKPPSPVNRYLNYDYGNIFDSQSIDRVREFGFIV